MNHKKTYYENGNIKEMIMNDYLGISGLSYRVTYRENHAGKIWIECFTLMEKRHGEYKRHLLDGTLIGHHFFCNGISITNDIKRFAADLTQLTVEDKTCIKLIYGDIPFLVE